MHLNDPLPFLVPRRARALPLALLLVGLSVASGCADSHGIWDEPDPDVERMCEIHVPEPDRVLEPAPDNPRACPRPEACGFWFGHGAHFACNEYPEFSCDVWDCTCDTTAYADEAFEADFAVGLATLRLTGGAVCRYRIWGPG